MKSIRRIEWMVLKATLLKVMCICCHSMALQMTRKMLLNVERKWHSWHCTRKTHFGDAVVEDGLLGGEVLVVGALEGELQAGVVGDHGVLEGGLLQAGVVEEELPVDGVLEGGLLQGWVVEGEVSVDGALEGEPLQGRVVAGELSEDGALEGGLQGNSIEGDVPGHGELEEDHVGLQGKEQTSGEDLYPVEGHLVDDDNLQGEDEMLEEDKVQGGGERREGEQSDEDEQPEEDVGFQEEEESQVS